MGSLKDALLEAGLSSSKKERSRPAAKRTKPQRAKPKQKAVRDRVLEETDLARAYRARQQAEKQDAEQKKKAKLAQQEARRQRNLALEEILKDQLLNDPEADCPRYFQFRERIRRVLCTPEQRQALNEGQLAVVVFKGGPKLVPLETARQVLELAPDLVPDLSAKVSQSDPLDEHDYPPVPDDLMW